MAAVKLLHLPASWQGSRNALRGFGLAVKLFHLPASWQGSLPTQRRCAGAGQNVLDTPPAGTDNLRPTLSIPLEEPCPCELRHGLSARWLSPWRNGVCY